MGSRAAGRTGAESGRGFFGEDGPRPNSFLRPLIEGLFSSEEEPEDEGELTRRV